MENRLKYRDENDKSYGATGMALSLVVLDGEDMLTGITLDCNPGEMMEMHSSFYFTGNPGISAKAAWQQMKHNFGLSVAMLIGNVMSRWMVQERKVIEPEIRNTLTERVVQEGENSIGLEADEIRDMFNQEYAYLYNVFSHQRLHGVIHEFAETLRSRRQMSRMEIIDLLRTLNMI
ncbi:MAG: hypothetical protein J1E38_02015 [Paramuribaculum sp.]|nr:hypothetical protein [Paramuribaculum sp.]